MVYNYGWMDDRLVHNKIIKYLDKKVKYKVIKKELNVFGGSTFSF